MKTISKMTDANLLTSKNHIKCFIKQTKQLNENGDIIRLDRKEGVYYVVITRDILQIQKYSQIESYRIEKIQYTNSKKKRAQNGLYYLYQTKQILTK